VGEGEPWLLSLLLQVEVSQCMLDVEHASESVGGILAAVNKIFLFLFNERENDG